MDLDKRVSKLNEHPKDSSNARIEDFLSKIEGIKSYLLENREIITESVDESQGGKGASNLITEVVGMIDSYREAEDVILYESDLDMFPDIHLFNGIDEIENEAEINQLEEDPNTSLSYYSLLEFSDLEPSELSNLDSGQIRDRRQKAGRELTQTFDKYWDQSDIEIKMELSGGRVSLHLYDESNVRKQPSDRSTGLRWFLSFLARVITQSKGGLLDSIILLDDPGVHLHPNGHKDLRKALTRLAEDNQVIYSTHSPYMIDTGNISRIRVVERAEQRMGTKVKRIGRKDTTSDDSLAPVRASLGATFSDSLFSSKYTILVEGFEDRVYLNRFSELFRRTNEGPFFDADMKIIDCGGASKTDYMSRLVNAENYEYAVLLDSDDSGKQAEETLLEEEIPKERVTMISSCIGEEGDKTIEDLFSEEFFCEVASEVHNMGKEEVLESLSDSPKPLVKRVDGAIKQIAEIEDAEGMILDKRSVAKKINKGISEGEYSIQDVDNNTLSNFESVIRTIVESLNLECDEGTITNISTSN
ncbi:AAA family ATPase [Natrinema sp. DC36]|uniref:ATP-dependent nuclease n=1 Tax=Natrinema sp. DC36 TaxID=2878680 RepID=UPI001CF03B68|nr:AAA family ATPase [Natrinema sp. DC36]